MSQYDFEKVNERINTICGFLPNDFQRQIRDLTHYEMYKATEFRQFILYVGPVVLQGRIPKNDYDLFVHLHFAIYCLCSDKSSELLSIAKYCIREYLKQYERLYGVGNQTYNNTRYHFKILKKIMSGD